MDITKYSFPEPSMCLSTDNALLKEARARGFYNGNTPYNHLFSSLFFRGGELMFKPDLDEGFKSVALPYLKAFMGSFEPKHEEKEAIAAMILSEMVVEPKDK